MRLGLPRMISVMSLFDEISAMMAAGGRRGFSEIPFLGTVVEGLLPVCIVG